MHRPARTVFLSFALFIVAVGAAAQEISTVSPFLPVGTPVGPATENSPVEFRGMIKSEEGLAFGLFDPVKRRSAWVKLNEAGREFLVRSFDEGSETAVVEYQGRSLTVVLKSPKIESVPVGRMPPGVAAVGGPNQPPPPATVNAASQAEEARRLELVTAEVRRRRAARQAATQSQPQPVPQQPAVQPAQPQQPLRR